ncbi:MAG: DedA family protein [Bradymonadales bacterium]|nr:DedA family protein [Bradymonadales bacterium]
MKIKDLLKKPQQWIRSLYDWVLHWAETPYGMPALAILAFAESSFFPIPPDVLLIALALGLPKKSLRFALVCALFSVVGGVAGYAIGAGLWELVDQFFFSYVFSEEAFLKVATLYNKWAFWAVFIAGFTPIPYKVFTITAGVCAINFPMFFLASIVSRSARFFLVGSLIYFFGPSIKGFIDKYFNTLVVVFTVLLVGGFVLIKYVL